MLQRNAHTQIQKEFVVRKLAAFEPPRAITTAFVAAFPETACNENDVLAVDPETTVVSPELYALFLAERERILLDPRSAPFADQRARLIALSNHAKFYSGNNQFPEMRNVLRQIAEEQGTIGKGKAAVSSVPVSADGPVVTEIVRRIVDPKAVE